MISPYFSYMTFAFVIIAVILRIQQTNAKCDECGPNSVACISNSSFHLCYDKIPDTSQTFSCVSGAICTQLSMVCIAAESGVEPDCLPKTACSKCDENQLFTCTSSTTYARCIDGQVQSVSYKCPRHLFCDTRTSEICVDECHLDLGMPECDLDEPLIGPKV
ncbi:uncharacterized protein LOC106094246 [Stomoxys calcitrans]|uniref:Chitin-binding type-2 domain-containing protein n=1 Tax=Stomoxys calcitrans TaxID=35570 RepID=A0A1I8PC25_STOCA|nr:uncharacterized protein LOC106094246 [Stomoxys calcitrans]